MFGMLLTGCVFAVMASVVRHLLAMRSIGQDLPLDDMRFTNASRHTSSFSFWVPARVHSPRMAAYIVYCLVEAETLPPQQQYCYKKGTGSGYMSASDVLSNVPEEVKDELDQAMRRVHSKVRRHLPTSPTDSFVLPDAEPIVENVDVVDGRVAVDEDDADSASKGKRDMCEEERKVCLEAIMCLFAVFLVRATRVVASSHHQCFVFNVYACVVPVRCTGALMRHCAKAILRTI